LLLENVAATGMACSVGSIKNILGYDGLIHKIVTYNPQLGYISNLFILQALWCMGISIQSSLISIAFKTSTLVTSLNKCKNMFPWFCAKQATINWLTIDWIRSQITNISLFCCIHGLSIINNIGCSMGHNLQNPLPWMLQVKCCRCSQF